MLQKENYNLTIKNEHQACVIYGLSFGSQTLCLKLATFCNMKNLLLLLGTAMLLSGCLADIRTVDLKNEEFTKANREKGRNLLQAMAEAHGVQAYQQHKSVSAVLRDEWSNGVAKLFAMPWHANNELVQLDYWINTYDSSLQFKEGKAKGTIWGIQNWATYTRQSKTATPVFKKNKAVKFWLPTIQYFIAMPFAIQEATVVSYAGEATVNDKKYDLVAASWETLAPQKNIDQYLLWINRETKLLDYAQYTVRDMFSFITGTMTYEDYRAVDGVWLAFKQTAGGEPGSNEKFMHRYVLETLTFDAITDSTVLYPKPNYFETKQ